MLTIGNIYLWHAKLAMCKSWTSHFYDSRVYIKREFQCIHTFISHFFLHCVIFLSSLHPAVPLQSITSGSFVSLAPFFLLLPSVAPISSPCQSRCQCAALSDTPHLLIHVWARARRRHNRLRCRRAAIGIQTLRGCVSFRQPKRRAKKAMTADELECHAETINPNTCAKKHLCANSRFQP